MSDSQIMSSGNTLKYNPSLNLLYSNTFNVVLMTGAVKVLGVTPDVFVATIPLSHYQFTTEDALHGAGAVRQLIPPNFVNPPYSASITFNVL